ncbi:PhoPQ-activated pathogenicity-related protein [Armatimonadetes bacterium GBS]|nr:PhoPQ-activated pathogenicity-related protein [Armatimonadetes bacterium GBS]
MRIIVWFLAALLWSSACADLEKYVRAESPFEWSKTITGKVSNSEFVELTLISQKWREFIWRHRLRIVKPVELKNRETAILYITGSGDGRSELQLIARAAERVGAIAAVLHDVPNQPLIRPDLVEDNLIAHTYVQFWETGDPTWPLLFPMVKSAVRAMDAIQAFCKQEWQIEIKGFTVTGASKRGWTTWLTAAVDSRVRAIAPMVFDNLNFFKQMPHQLELWGRYSEQISEYYERGLMEKMLTERGRQLVSWVDPYSYRERYTMPILIINGANDPYWATDAARFYFDDLPSKNKYALYVPNGGHGLGDYERVVNTLCAFYLMATGKIPFPGRVEAKTRRQGDSVAVEITAERTPEKVQVWGARADNLDFRPVRWEPIEAHAHSSHWHATVPMNGKNIAVFAELTYRAEGFTYTITTIPEIVRR